MYTMKPALIHYTISEHVFRDRAVTDNTVIQSIRRQFLVNWFGIRRKLSPFCGAVCDYYHETIRALGAQVMLEKEFDDRKVSSAV